MSTNFNLEIYSEHFRNGKSPSIEECMIGINDQDLKGNINFMLISQMTVAKMHLVHMHA